MKVIFSLFYLLRWICPFRHCKNRVVKFGLRFEIIYLVLDFGSRTHINTFFQIFLDIFENG